jgi:Sulfotransferase domain
MALRVIGAGLARTGTTSLKLALEHLLGGPCYHMFELVARPEDVPIWHQAACDQAPTWPEFLDGYAAAVDLPAAAFWRELAAASPDALILLSVRDCAGQWWDSFSQTIGSQPPPALPPHVLAAGFTDMITATLARIGMTNPASKDAMIAAYERHNQAVRDLAPPGRLLEWRPADGWAPLANALGLPVPARPFPEANTRAEFRAKFLAGATPAEPAGER